MHKANKAWSVTILKEPDWKEHFLPERKRPVREITAAEDVALDNIESIEYAQLREFAEIMGLRRKELLLTWPQVDFNEKVIRIIGKGDVPATLPLTRRAYEILWGLRGNDRLHVFTFVAQRTRRCPKTGRDFVKGKRYPMTYYGIGTNRRRKWINGRGCAPARHPPHDRSAHPAHHGQPEACPDAVAPHRDRDDREVLHRHHDERSSRRNGERRVPEKIPD